MTASSTSVPVIRHPRAGLSHGRRTPEAPASAATLEGSTSVIGVAASVGGPQALAAVFAEVPGTFPIPILVVQHIVEGFGEGFTRWLDGQVPLAARVAPDGGEAGPGIWVAPDGAHLTLDGAGRLVVDPHTDAGLHRPSADVLLRSLAARAGRDAVAVVLTGMGRDGAEGLDAVRRAGGLPIAQDEASSGVYGMPRAAAERGAELILAPDEIGRVLRALRPVAPVS
jgi:two-component system chemotaxis response regulator CheB